MTIPDKKTVISKEELERICNGIAEDRATIIKHNPIGSDEETLLWMLLSVLISYLSLDEKEIPCFPGDVNAATYRKAVEMIIENRLEGSFDASESIDRMLE